MQDGEIFVNTHQNSKTPTGQIIKVNEKEFMVRNFPINGEDHLTIKINNINYDFKLDKDQYFYFVISEDIQGEKHITTNN